MAKIRRTSAAAVLPDSHMGRRAQMRKKRKHRRRRIGISLLLVTVILAIVALYLSLVLFRVEQVVVDGQTRYSYEEIFEASQIVDRQILISVNPQRTKERIEVLLPYAGEVSVKRALPGTVRITVNDTAAASAVLTAEGLYAVDENLKILEHLSGPNAALVTVAGGEFSKPPQPGEKLSYEDALIGKIHIDILSALKDNKLLEEAQYIDLADKLSVKVQLSGRFVLLFGDYLSLDVKTAFASKILERLAPTDMGYIELSDQQKGSFIHGDEEILIFTPQASDSDPVEECLEGGEEAQTDNGIDEPPAGEIAN